MNWKESHKFVESLSKKDRKRYMEINNRYISAGCDGHDAHLSACQELEEEMQTPKPPPKRAIEIEGINQTLIISKATSVRTNQEMIHLDKMKDGTWRIIYNENLIPDFSKVKAFKVIRED